MVNHESVSPSADEILDDVGDAASAVANEVQCPWAAAVIHQLVERTCDTAGIEGVVVSATAGSRRITFTPVFDALANTEESDCAYGTARGYYRAAKKAIAECSRAGNCDAPAMGMSVLNASGKDIGPAIESFKKSLVHAQKASLVLSVTKAQ